jgi:hypothetical protein
MGALWPKKIAIFGRALRPYVFGCLRLAGRLIVSFPEKSVTIWPI